MGRSSDIYVCFFYLSCCCDCHTSSNFRVLAFIEACVKVWILLRLAVNVFVMSAKSKTPRALCQRFCLTSSFQYLSVVKKLFLTSKTVQHSLHLKITSAVREETTTGTVIEIKTLCNIPINPQFGPTLWIVNCSTVMNCFSTIAKKRDINDRPWR